MQLLASQEVHTFYVLGLSSTKRGIKKHTEATRACPLETFGQLGCNDLDT